MSQFLILIFISLTAFSLRAAAHGADKPGPHGGYVSMPGAFHLEVVPSGKTRIKAYLLDANFENPTLKRSSIRMSVGAAVAVCRPEAEHFVCDFPKSVDLGRKGELKIDSVREKAKGNTVTYSLPLEFAS